MEAEQIWIIPCLTIDKICLFTDTGMLHQVKVTDIPYGKLRDKGTPIDNLSKYDGTKERPVYVTSSAALKGKQLLFATAEAMVKLVPGEEFDTNNRAVAATKLQEEDRLLSVQPVEGRDEAVLQTTNGVFLRFPLEEISVLKKNSRGVRGIKLGRDEKLEVVYLLGGDAEQTTFYKEKQVYLNRLKIGKRDGKGSRVRL